jgi:hypothetical protein
MLQALATRAKTHHSFAFAFGIASALRNLLGERAVLGTMMNDRDCFRAEQRR